MAMMDCPFTQLFNLPDEVVQEKVLSMLSFVDIAHLDSALANKAARVVVARWCNNMWKDIEINSTTSNSFLIWLNARRIKINAVEYNDDYGECKQRFFESAQITAKEARFSLKRPISVTFLASLRGLHTLQAYSFEQNNDAVVWHRLLELNPSIGHFRLKGQWTFDNTISIFQNLITCCKNIHTLEINCNIAGDDAVAILALHYPRLRHLQLLGCGVITDKTFLALGQHCTALVRLQLRAHTGTCTAEGITHLLTHCTMLCVLYMGHFTDVSVRSVMAANPLTAKRLTDVHIHGWRNMSDLTLAALFHNKPAMRVITLTFFTGVSEEQLVRIVQDKPNLQRLEICDMERVTDSVLSVLVHSCLQLRSVLLDGCTAVTDVAVFAASPCLEYLSFTDCTAVSQESLLQLAASPGPPIKVSACKQSVTAETRKALQGSTRISLQPGSIA